jgi:L-threonylcarbamoyladenylate synthase
MNILEPNDDVILFASEALKSGELVGFPTETVYGIAADATNASAVLKTFKLKRRPAENPLIVHVASLADAEPLVTEIPEAAKLLAKWFWPGPLTIVLPKSSILPLEVTGGLDTVAIRMPRHPVALAIIVAAGRPLSAPSANAFMGLSPTTAQNIAPEIVKGLACVVDGGACEVGVESTVVDCCGPKVVVLRPGGISRRVIEIALGAPTSLLMPKEHRAPGMYLRHYSPLTSVRLVDELGPTDAGIGFDKPKNAFQIQLPRDPTHYAKALYSSLNSLDQMGRPELLIESPPETDAWEAVWDRLQKAAGP